MAEFDHIFICVSCGACEAARLVSFGLTEGAPNAHPGQGTSCRRFFFHNGYLELLWVNDPSEAQSEVVRPTHLWDRWAHRSAGACPFGLGFRPGGQGGNSLPFPAWEYHPHYLPETLSFHVATNADVLTEPMLFYLFFSQRPDMYTGAKRQIMEHAAGLREITRIEVVSPFGDNHSPPMQKVLRAELAKVRMGVEYLVELGFDGELRGQVADFRPDLPLLFSW